MCQVFICTKKGTAVDWHLLKVPEINDNIYELCLTDNFSNESKEQYNYNNEEPNFIVEYLINLP